MTMNFRPKCISCGAKWVPPVGIDAHVTPCAECQQTSAMVEEAFSAEPTTGPCEHKRVEHVVADKYRMQWCTNCGAYRDNFHPSVKRKATKIPWLVEVGYGPWSLPLRETANPKET